MTTQPAPRIALLLPLAIFLHQLEEWFGGFVPWINQVVGFEITAELGRLTAKQRSAP